MTESCAASAAQLVAAVRAALAEAERIFSGALKRINVEDMARQAQPLK